MTTTNIEYIEYNVKFEYFIDQIEHYKSIVTKLHRTGSHISYSVILWHNGLFIGQSQIGLPRNQANEAPVIIENSLFLFSISEGDTDSDFFAHMQVSEINWRNTHGETLGYFVGFFREVLEGNQEDYLKELSYGTAIVHHDDGTVETIELTFDRLSK